MPSTLVPTRPLWSVAAALVAHNAEEAATFGRWLPVVRERAPAVARGLAASVTERQLLVALAVATAVPIAAIAWAAARPASRAARWLALLVAAVLALNVASHLASAAWLGGYAPGLATAVLVNLPVCSWLLRRAVRERWLERGALLALAPAAVAVHGPLLVGLITLAAVAR